VGNTQGDLRRRRVKMKGYRASKLEEMLTQSLKEGNDERAKEIEKRILQKEKKK